MRLSIPEAHPHSELLCRSYLVWIFLLLLPPPLNPRYYCFPTWNSYTSGSGFLERENKAQHTRSEVGWLRSNAEVIQPLLGIVGYLLDTYPGSPNYALALLSSGSAFWVAGEVCE